MRIGCFRPAVSDAPYRLSRQWRLCGIDANSWSHHLAGMWDSGLVTHPETGGAPVGGCRRTRASIATFHMQKEIFEQPVALANTLEMLGTGCAASSPVCSGANSEAVLKETVRY